MLDSSPISRMTARRATDGSIDVPSSWSWRDDVMSGLHLIPPTGDQGRRVGGTRRRGSQTSYRSTARSSCALVIFERPSMPFCRASLYSWSLVRPRGPPCERSPPRRPEEMSSVDVRLGSLASPARARSLLTVARRDLLRLVLTFAAVEQAFLDVLVLSLALVAPCRSVAS